MLEWLDDPGESAGNAGLLELYVSESVHPLGLSRWLLGRMRVSGAACAGRSISINPADRGRPDR
jgi:hypothetical protein